MARAVAAAGDTGTVVVSQTNEEGARSAQADLASLCGPLHVGTGNHCRVFWSLASTRRKDPQLCDAWEKLDAPRPIGDGRFISRPGVFAWDRIDPASALLADCLPRELSGRGADLGAGFGMLSVELIERCAGVTSLDLFEADARALALCEVNLAAANLRRTGGPVPSQLHWHDVTRGVPGSYDFIVSNPPFHETRKDDPSLGRAFIVRAAQSLRPGGSLWLVANRHLPYEPTLAANFSSVREVRVQHGFKVLHATRGER